jgi:type III secretory pathway component EscS
MSFLKRIGYALLSIPAVILAAVAAIVVLALFAAVTAPSVVLPIGCALVIVAVVLAMVAGIFVAPVLVYQATGNTDTLGEALGYAVGSRLAGFAFAR